MLAMAGMEPMVEMVFPCTMKTLIPHGMIVLPVQEAPGELEEVEPVLQLEEPVDAEELVDLLGKVMKNREERFTPRVPQVLPEERAKRPREWERSMSLGRWS